MTTFAVEKHATDSSFDNVTTITPLLKPFNHVPTGLNHKGQVMNGETGWYTLQGVKISCKPTKPGLYIHNGMKIFVK